jgi:hypothetical protein
LESLVIGQGQQKGGILAYKKEHTQYHMAETPEKNKNETVDMMEARTQEAVNKIGNSSIGKSIPLEIEKIALRDITKYLLLFNMLNTIPSYLISAQTQSSFKLLEWVKPTLSFLVAMTWVISAAINCIAFFVELDSFVKFALFATAAKIGVVGAVLLLNSLPKVFLTVMSVIYALSLAIMEGLFLYYLAIYLHRLESDRYDSRGEETKAEKV